MIIFILFLEMYSKWGTFLGYHSGSSRDNDDRVILSK